MYMYTAECLDYHIIIYGDLDYKDSLILCELNNYFELRLNSCCLESFGVFREIKIPVFYNHLCIVMIIMWAWSVQ